MIPYVSPKTNEPLSAVDGALVSASGERFEVVNGIPRFVSADNYAKAFGHQWHNFAKTQLDSYNGLKESESRLLRCVGLTAAELRGKTILEVGSGAGRFTEVLVKFGAFIHSIDLSNAVEVNRKNIGEASNYQIAQASVYDIPYADASFDIVLCLGVVQHTPSSERTIETLWRKVKPGGLLVIDHYRWRLGYYSTLTPLFRFFLKRMQPENSERVVNTLVDFFFPIHWKLNDRGVLNWLVHRVSPLIVYIRQFPQLSYETHLEWSRMDTYDQLTDYYKHLHTPAQIARTLKLLGGKNIWINEAGNGVEARCTK